MSEDSIEPENIYNLKSTNLNETFIKIKKNSKNNDFCQ